MKETLGFSTKSRNSLRIEQDALGQASINGTHIQILGSDSSKLNDNVYELTPELHKSLSSTGFTGKNLKDDSDNFT